ncbi:MAG TPA: flavin reductase family protein [Firmicutes bacterium]|nr:flavin reductase family protein [Bacillota bacterium]
MLRALDHPYAYAQLVADRLKKGIMVVSVDQNGKPNVMAASWGFFGYQWSRPVYIVPVQPPRYTHGLIAQSGEFVISVQPESMDDDMLFSGACSGRDVDKFQARGLTPVAMPIPGFKTPGISGALLHLACRVIHTAGAKPLSPHTFFFGEIVGAYADALP